MTDAVLFATATTQQGRAAALLPLADGTVIGRLRVQLEATGVDRFLVLARPGDADAFRAQGFDVAECRTTGDELRAVATFIDGAGGRVVLCAGDLVSADSAVTSVVESGRHGDTAMVSRSGDGDALHPGVVSERGRVVRVGGGTDAAPSNADFRGLLTVNRKRAAAAVDASLPAVAGGTGSDAVRPGEAAGATPDTGDALTAVLSALVDAGSPVAAHRVPELPYERVRDAATATHLLGLLQAIDEDEVRLRLAVKRRDDLFATYAVSTYSLHLVRWAARWGLTPTAVTWISVAVALLASAAFVHGGRVFLVLGGIGLYVSFVLDCVDGQLARYLHRSGRFGGWLDTIADRSKEYLVYGALAFGATRAGIEGVWPLAVAAMVLLTTRHMTDTWYGTLQDEAAARRNREAHAAPRSLSSRLGAALGQVSDRVQSNRASVMYWLKRTIALPIGERWMLIALTTMFFDGRAALVALLVWGGVAATYTLTGRVLRSRGLAVPVLTTVDCSLHRDDGVPARLLGEVGRGLVPPLVVSLLPALVVLSTVVPGLSGLWQGVGSGLALAVAYAAAAVAALAARHPHLGPLHWLVPAALRGSEYAVVLLTGSVAGVPAPLMFGLAAVLALYHYDLTARLERRRSPLLWRRLGLGWDGRLAVLGLATLLGVTAEGFAALTGYLAVIFVGSALAGLATSGRTAGTASARADATEPRTRVPVATRSMG